MMRRRWTLYAAVFLAVVLLLALTPLGSAFAAEPCIVECQEPPPADCPPRTGCVKPPPGY